MASMPLLPRTVVQRIGQFIPFETRVIFGVMEEITPLTNPLHLLFRPHYVPNRKAMEKLWQGLQSIWPNPNIRPPVGVGGQQRCQHFGVDLDMLFCHIPVAHLPEGPFLDYHCNSQPALKVTPDKPQHFVQISNYPCGLFVVPKAGQSMEDCKKWLCDMLYASGIEQPIPFLYSPFLFPFLYSPFLFPFLYSPFLFPFLYSPFPGPCSEPRICLLFVSALQWGMTS